MVVVVVVVSAAAGLAAMPASEAVAEAIGSAAIGSATTDVVSVVVSVVVWVSSVLVQAATVREAARAARMVSLMEVLRTGVFLLHKEVKLMTDPAL